MKKIGRGDAVKLYILEKALSSFGNDAVSRLTDDMDGLSLYFYVNKRVSIDQGKAMAEAAFPGDVFHGGNVLKGIDVMYGSLRNSGAPNEQVFKVSFTGSLTALADNAQKNDPEGFEAALNSQRAQQLLRREKDRETSLGGI